MEDGLFCILKKWLTDHYFKDRNQGYFFLILTIFFVYVTVGAVLVAISNAGISFVLVGFSITTAVISGIVAIVFLIMGLYKLADYYNWN